MRGLVFPISPGRPHIISAAFILIIFAACATDASARKTTPLLPALAPQAQGGTDSSTTQKPQKKKGLTPVRHEEAADGSRVTITYNEPLSDYSAYREGDRFVVVIPKADAPRVRQNMRGRGFDGVQVSKRGDDTVLSFRIQPGVGARVAQQFNKLEVVFSAPQKAASNPGQSSSSTSQASAINATQVRTATPPSPQTPLNNHNSTTENANQPMSAKASAGSAGEAGTSSAQQAVAGDSSLKPSNSNSTAQPLAGQTTTAQQTPAAVSVSPEAASSETALGRYLLPLLIAALLLASAYAVIAARRRTERGEDIKARTPAAAAPVEVKAEKLAAMPESAGARASVDKEPEAVHRYEPVEMEAEAAAPAATPEISQPDEVEAARPEEAAEPETASFDLEPAITTETQDGVVSLEASADRGMSEIRSTGMEAERPMPEAVGVATQSNPVEAFVGAAAAGATAHTPARVVGEPAMPERAASLIPIKTLSYLKSEDANERAAGVLDLADIGNDEAYGYIGAAFDDPVAQVRDAAARALFNINEDRAASFKRIMRASTPERRRRIGAAIASSGMAGEAISDISSQSGERAFDALLVLSLMAKAGEVQSLIETIEDHPSTEVRLALVKLLALSGQPDMLKTFRYLATRDSLPIAVRSSIMEAIYQLSNS
ncbi:MAG TPA: HEAT repeat domain-containing protein [Pyrinomonadaceae bacterium]|jgi:hypothetical protein